MSYTIYRLADRSVVMTGLPVDPSIEGGDFAFDPATQGVAEGAPDDVASCEWVPADLAWRRSPQIARDRQWDKAKAYCIERQVAPLALSGILTDGGIVVAERNEKGQAWIDRYSIAAVGAVAIGVPLEITLTDGVNNRVPLNAAQILALGQASLTQQSLCHNASQAVRAALDAALAAGATAEQIEAIDITAGYPE